MGENTNTTSGFLEKLFTRLRNHGSELIQGKRRHMSDDAFEKIFHCKMAGKGERLSTFTLNSWKSDVSAEEMSAAGFCCLERDGPVTPVVCFKCKGVVVGTWLLGDSPRKVHRHLFPKCAFLKTSDKSRKAGGSFSVPFLRLRPTAFDAVCTTSDAAENEDSGDRPTPLGDCAADFISTQDFFSNEHNRLITFVNWPEDSLVDRASLAAAGLYRLGDTSDLVKCFACLKEIGGWRGGDVPMVTHLNQSPHCPFVNQQETGNRRITEHEKQQAEAFFRQSSLMHPTAREDGTQSTGIVTSPSGEPFIPVKHEQYCEEQERLKTFASWPRDHCQSPETLARAGFFSVGKEDRVACFSCGGQLQDWEPDDDPFDEHASHYPDCKWIELERCKNRVVEMREQLRMNDDDTEANGGDPRQTSSSGDRKFQSVIEFEPNEVESGKTALSPRGEGMPEESSKPTENIVDDTEVDFRAVEELHIHDSGGETNSKRRSKTKEGVSAEMEILRDRNLCKICMDLDVEVLFLPCKHLSVCGSCAGRLAVCPICREYIDERISVFVT